MLCVVFLVVLIYSKVCTCHAPSLHWTWVYLLDPVGEISLLGCVAASCKAETSTKAQEARHDPSRVATFDCVFCSLHVSINSRFGSLCVGGQSYGQLKIWNLKECRRSSLEATLCPEFLGRMIMNYGRLTHLVWFQGLDILSLCSCATLFLDVFGVLEVLISSIKRGKKLLATPCCWGYFFVSLASYLCLNLWRAPQILQNDQPSVVQQFLCSLSSGKSA